MKTLRDATIKLAFEKPHLREHLLPILKQAKVLQVGETAETEVLRMHMYRGQLKVWDLTNAGKRGKTVDSLSIEIWGKPSSNVAWLATLSEKLFSIRNPRAAFTLIDKFGDMVKSEDPALMVTLSKGKAKGVDVAPTGFKPFVISNDYMYLKADFDHFTIRNLEDRFNEPTCIPATRGTKKSINGFYRWVKDNQSAIKSMTYQEVLSELRKAGVDYHSYCAMD